MFPSQTTNRDSKVDLSGQDEDEGVHRPLQRTFSLTKTPMKSNEPIDQAYLRRSIQKDILCGIPFRGAKEYLLGFFCAELYRSEAAEEATVTRLVRYCTRETHHYLLLEVVRKNHHPNPWIRLDRRQLEKSGNIFKTSLYQDLASLGMSINGVLEQGAQEDAVIKFNSPVPLKPLFKSLDVVREEFFKTNALSEENRFFASIVQEICIQFLGGSFSGQAQLSCPTMATGRRRVIKARVYKVLPTWVPILVAQVESLVAMTHDRLIIEAFSKLAHIIGAQNELLFCCGVEEAKLRSGFHSSMIQLLCECKAVLYEHIHGLSSVPGARKFRRQFANSDLTAKLASWVGSAGGNLKIFQRLDRNKVDTMDVEIRDTFFRAFEKDTVKPRTDSGLLRLQWKGQDCSGPADLELALWTIGHLEFPSFQQALLGEPRGRLKRDIAELRASIPAEVEFASKSWFLLLCQVDYPDSGVIGALEHFIREWFSYWIVAMGIMDEIDAACLGLHRLEQWMRRHDQVPEKLRLFIFDVYRFILRSKRVLCEHPLLVFSALPTLESASPTSSCKAVVITRMGDTQGFLGRISLKLPDHPYAVCSLAYSPHGTLLASAFRDKCIWLWNAITGARTSKLDLPFDCVHVTFSPDSSQVACACENGLICIRNVDGSGRLGRLAGHSKRVNSVAFSPYGTRLASGSGDTTIRIWDAVDGSHIRTLLGHTDVVVSVAYSPDGRRLASASYDESVRVWDAASGEQIGRIDVFSPIFCLAFHPDGERVILACRDHVVRVLDIFGKHDNLLRLENHSDAVYSVSCSTDGKWIASASADSSVSLWRADGQGWTHVFTFASHTGRVYAVTFSPNGTMVTSGSGDRSIRIWDAVTAAEHWLWGEPFEIASNARCTVSVEESRIIRIADSGNPNAASALLRGHPDSVTCTCFSPDGEKLVSASRDLSILVWNIASGQCTKRVNLTEVVKKVQSQQASFPAPYHISYSKDGTVLRVRGWKVSENSEGPYTIYLNTGTWTESLTARPDGAFAATYQPDPTLPIVLDQNCLFTRSRNGLVYLHNLPDHFEPISEVIQIGRRVSVGGRGGEVVYANFEGLKVL